ncbi:MAG: hypothetical protein AAFP80_02740 [Pseudomonadota bacterium]
MRIILHLGTGKTGTTSLQAAMGRLRDQLLAQGIWYPDNPYAEDDSHHLLIGLYGEGLNEGAKISGSPSIQRKDMRSKALEFAKYIHAQAQKIKPHTVVISSELLIPSQEKNVTRLSEALYPITDDIRPIAYVREPADWYKSRLQQSAKGCVFHKPFPTPHLRTAFESIESAFEHRMLVRKFARKDLIGNDIVSDFLEGVLGVEAKNFDYQKVSENASISGESAFALLVLGDALSRSRNPIFRLRMKWFRSWLKRNQHQLGNYSKHEIKPKLVQDIRRTSTDYLWLKEHYGIEFEALNYEAIEPLDEATERRYQRPSHVCVVNEEKLASLLFEYMEKGMLFDVPNPLKVFSAFARKRSAHR